MLLLALCLGGASPALADPPAAPTRATVTLVVLGTFPRELVDAVEAALRAELQVEVRRTGELPLPRVAWYPPRHRYRADKILEYLHELPAAQPAPGATAAPRVLALTGVDISTTKGRYDDWGVFGLGEVGGRSAVLSDFRLRRGASGPDHLRRRVVSVAMHEIGHALGLPHCSEDAARCLMLDAEGSIRTVDTGNGHLGPACRALLDERSPLVSSP
jgi:archaemetzincin